MRDNYIDMHNNKNSLSTKNNQVPDTVLNALTH